MFTEALDWLAGQLDAAGIPAAIDPADLQVPGVWLVPGTMTAPTQAGHARQDVTCHLYLVTGNAGARHDLAALDQLATAVAGVLVIRDLEAVRVSLPNHTPGGAPGYHTTTTVTITP